jgi:hypothetical protein
MNWKLKALIIWVMAVPAFTGFPINHLPGNLLAGISYGWLAYGAMVYAAIILILGKKVYRITLVVALSIAIPLVVLGILISSVGLLISGWDQAYLDGRITHYISLMVTMVVVIPLALSMVAVLPFHRLERHILQSKNGVRTSEKIILMFLRVFSHIFYFVLPNILEVIREEGILKRKTVLTGGDQSTRLPLSFRIKEVVQMLVNIGVEAICSAIRYLPLWAEEISRLPGYEKKKRNHTTAEPPRE